jgi:hypothetical protein
MNLSFSLLWSQGGNRQSIYKCKILSVVFSKGRFEVGYFLADLSVQWLISDQGFLRDSLATAPTNSLLESFYSYSLCYTAKTQYRKFETRKRKSPNFHIHVSVSDLCIPTIDLSI